MEKIWHGFLELPLLAKAVIGVLAVVAAGVLAFITFFVVSAMGYERTVEKLLVKLNCGADVLTINSVRHQFVGGSSTGNRLYWNGKAVAKGWTLPGPGQADQAIPIDPDDLKTLTVNSLADTADTRGWTVWVSPEVFSRAEFEALTNCLRQHRADIQQQIDQRLKGKPDLGAMVAGTGIQFTIAAVVYGQGDRLEERLYHWKTSWGEPYQLSIRADGLATVRQGSVNMSVGKVQLLAGKRVLYWQYQNEIPLLVADLARFKNPQGAALADRYELRPVPENGQLFFRQTAAYYEQLFIGGTADQLRPGSFYAEGGTVDLKVPTEKRNYTAGTIQVDSTGQHPPVFAWYDWPGHPLTEADLRQFRNEQGQSLGDLYVFKYQPGEPE